MCQRNFFGLYCFIVIFLFLLHSRNRQWSIKKFNDHLKDNASLPFSELEDGMILWTNFIFAVFWPTRLVIAIVFKVFNLLKKLFVPPSTVYQTEE